MNQDSTINKAVIEKMVDQVLAGLIDGLVGAIAQKLLPAPLEKGVCLLGHTPQQKTTLWAEKEGKAVVLPCVALAKKLVTEATLKQLQLPQGSSILVAKETVFTPLAIDYYRDHGYQITKQ